MTDLLTIASSRLVACFDPLGARMRVLQLDGGANLILDADPVLHPGWHDVYPGVVIGPVANRVRDGRVVIAGATHQMPQNEGTTCLHSGPKGLHARTWRVSDHGDSSLTLNHALEDGEIGLPGVRNFTVTFEMQDTTLTVAFAATTTAPTPINMAHHPYWALGGTQRVQIAADSYLPVDADNLPTGRVAAVDGTGFDFRNARPLPPEIDHNLCLTGGRSAAPRHIATLTGDHAHLHIASTAPGLQVYGGTHLPTLPGTDIRPGAGIALEPQGWPDAANQPAFPSIMVTPAQPYRETTRYTLMPATILPCFGPADGKVAC
ncbi:MAG: galactose mutarotase [Pseudomonadota bacterium]